MNNNLPVFKLTINKDDNDSGVFAVALVNQPAIEVDFFAFSGNTKKNQFEFKEVNPDKQLLAGYLMIPDKLIYRNENGYEFFVTFDASTIELIAEKYNKKQFQNQFNKEHNPKNMLSDVFVKENWIVNSPEFDKSKSFGFDAIVGGWFGVVKVDDSAVWSEYIKTGMLKGFSVEGNFEMNLSEALKKHQKESPIKAYLRNLGKR